MLCPHASSSICSMSLHAMAKYRENGNQIGPPLGHTNTRRVRSWVKLSSSFSSIYASTGCISGRFEELWKNLS